MSCSHVFDAFASGGDSIFHSLLGQVSPRKLNSLLVEPCINEPVSRNPFHAGPFETELLELFQILEVYRMRYNRTPTNRKDE